MNEEQLAADKARNLGYGTVLCDYLPDNPGQHNVDEFHLVSTTDRNAVLEVAKNAEVDGVLAYASDPAAPTAAYVAEAMGLPTNPLNSVLTMSFKSIWREFLEENRFPVPRFISVDTKLRRIFPLCEDDIELEYPLIVKPTDSSGSKGVTVVESYGEIASAIARAKEYSRNGVLIIEEYIEKEYPYVIGGDIFVSDGKVAFWGLMDCIRDSDCPLIPLGEMMPTSIPPETYDAVQKLLQRLVDALRLQFGELNVEIIIGRGGTPYIIELGARAGGNMIPIQLSDASGVDLVKANVLYALGEKMDGIVWDCRRDCEGFYATYVIHSMRNGIFKGLSISRGIEENIYRIAKYVSEGDDVEMFDGAGKALGIVFLKFGSKEEMNRKIDQITTSIEPIVE